MFRAAWRHPHLLAADDSAPDVGVTAVVGCLTMATICRDRFIVGTDRVGRLIDVVASSSESALDGPFRHS